MRFSEKITRQEQEKMLGLVPVEEYVPDEVSRLRQDGELWDEISQRFKEELDLIRQQAHDGAIGPEEAGRLFADVYSRIDQAFQEARED